MAVNIATTSMSSPSMFGGKPSRDTTQSDLNYLRVAHRLVEMYCYKQFPVYLVTATYRIVDETSPLPAIEGFPVNLLHTVATGLGNSLDNITHDDKYIFNAIDWPSGSISVSYTGGLDPLLYDGIERQARVLADRKDQAPENVDLKIGSVIDKNYKPEFRGGMLAPDVKQMVAPFRDWVKAV